MTQRGNFYHLFLMRETGLHVMRFRIGIIRIWFRSPIHVDIEAIVHIFIDGCYELKRAVLLHAMLFAPLEQDDINTIAFYCCAVAQIHGYLRPGGEPTDNS